MKIYDEIAQRLPKAFARYPFHKATAIRLFCIECMGGSTKDAVTCEASTCFLWPHRGSAWDKSAVAQGARPADWKDRWPRPQESELPEAAKARLAALKAQTPSGT